jgi:hypothetical protein
MRLPLLSPASLSPEQQKLSEDMRQGIESNFKGFQAINSEGALIGPWNPWLRFSKFGGPIWELVKALSTSPTLPRPVREVAILVTGAHFHSAYELYAHVLIAEARGLPDEKIATIVAGQRPADLIPTRVKADSFWGFQNGASQIPWWRTGGSPCGQELHFARTMTRPSFGHWRKRAGTRVKVGGCWRWPKSTMAALGPKPRRSAASGCRPSGTGWCGSTPAGLKA